MLTENQVIFEQLLRLTATTERVETKLDLMAAKQEDIDDRLGGVETSQTRAKGFLAAVAALATIIGAVLHRWVSGFSGS